MIGPSGFMAAPSADSDFNDCECCTHCQTINDDMDNYCHLQRRVVREVCVKFEHFEGKTRTAEDAGGPR